MKEIEIIEFIKENTMLDTCTSQVMTTYELKELLNKFIQQVKNNGVLAVVSNSTVIETPLTYCPKCKSTDIRQYTKGTDKCNNCNHVWDIYRPFKGVE